MREDACVFKSRSASRRFTFANVCIIYLAATNRLTNEKESSGGFLPKIQLVAFPQARFLADLFAICSSLSVKPHQRQPRGRNAPQCALLLHIRKNIVYEEDSLQEWIIERYVSMLVNCYSHARCPINFTLSPSA